MRRLAWGILLACLTASPASGAAATGAPADPVARLAASLAQHPEDPDLLWALAREQRAAGRFDEAARSYARFEARFPERRDDAAFELGRALYEAGRHGEARRALERALARDGGDAAAHLYRGLVLRQLGDAAAADRALRMAAALDPEVAPETLLLRGLARIQAGERDAGESLLREAAELDPGGEIAGRARRILGRGAIDLSLEPYLQGGFEYDDNVTLDSGLALPGGAAKRRDVRWLVAAGVNWRPIRREDASLTLGYRFDQTKHDDLHAFDERSHLLFGSGAKRLTERITARFDLFAANTHLSSDPYLLRAGVRPNLLVELGPRAGLLRGFAEAEARDFRERTSRPSLERDGHLLGAGLEHYLGVGGHGGWSALGLRFARTDTQAERDLDGLAGAFDHDLWEASWQLQLPLPWELAAHSAVSFGYERYAHRNVIDFLTDDGVGTTAPDHRRDRVLDARIGLSRPLTAWTDLEISWRRIERHSNVDLYAYDREVLGMYLRLHGI